MAFLELALYRSVASLCFSSQRPRAREARISLERPLVIFGLCWTREFSRWAFPEHSVLQQTQLLCTGNYSLSSVMFLCICGYRMQKDAPREVLGLRKFQLQKVSCGIRSVTWMSWTAEGMGGQFMVGRERNNKGTTLCEFTSPFHGFFHVNFPALSMLESVRCFYISHVSHTTCLIIDGSVRPWGPQIAVCVLALMESLKRVSKVLLW